MTAGLEPVWADDCLNYSDYPHWISQLETPVFAEDVLVQGNLAYLAIRTAGIIIVEITHPGHPVQIGSLGGITDPDWTANASRLALDGIHLFVADGSGRLVHVVDVSDPTSPMPVTQFNTGVYPDGLALKDDWLYVAVQNTGVVVYDISDLSTPHVVDVLPVTLAHNVLVDGDLLYATGYTSSFSIFSLADPSAPVLLSQVLLPDEYETYDVAVLGDLVYVAGPLGTWIVDVSDPAAATLVGSIPQGATSITIDDHRAYLTPFDLEIYDLTDPLAPIRVSYLPMPSGGFFSPIKQVGVAGGYAFTAADDAGLLIADLAQGTAPPVITTLEFPTPVERLHLWGDFALAAAQTDGLKVIDLTAPESPALFVSLPTEDARAVIASGQLAYLADGGDGLKIIDLSTPSEPQTIGHLDTFSRVASGLDLRDDLVFMASGLSGLIIIDVTDPSAPTRVGEVLSAFRARDVCVIGNFACVANGWGGLQMVNITLPDSPFEYAVLSLPGQQEAVVLDGATLFIGGTGTGLRAVDITNPAVPTVLGWLPVEAQDLVRDGNTLMAAGTGGVTLVDCSDPTALKSMGFLPTWGDCATVAVTEAFLLAAGDHMHTAPRPCPAASGVGDLLPELSVWASLTGHPNPFNPRIEIAFELQQSQRISLEVYDVAGRRVKVLAAGEFTAATHRFSWDGTDSQGLASSAGCYFLLLRGGHLTQSLKVMLVR